MSICGGESLTRRLSTLVDHQEQQRVAPEPFISQGLAHIAMEMIHFDSLGLRGLEVDPRHQ